MTVDTKTDIWMPLVIGDYLKDTQHLDATKHGCYLLWLMHYWTKGPLPNSLDDLTCIGKLRGANAPSIAQALLDEFFTLEADGLWHQKRSDREIARWQGKKQKAQEKAAAAAAARWKDHVPTDAPSNAPSNAKSTPQAMLGTCPSPSPSPKDLELTLLSPETATGPKSSDFAQTWNSLCGELPRIKEFSDSRRKKVQARIKQGISLETFEGAVRACTTKPFLRGENNRNWTATFDWLIDNDRNIEKAIMEPYGSITQMPSPNAPKPKTPYEIAAEAQQEERRLAVESARKAAIQ